MEYTYTLEEMPSVVSKIFPLIRHKIVLFQGAMGVGKTTFIKAFCKYLGLTDKVSSPTFSLVNEYGLKDGKVYHFDFYRIEHITEAYDMGIEEYFNSGYFCLIEWGEKISKVLPECFTTIQIARASQRNARKLTIAS